MTEDYMSWIYGLREDLQAAELRIQELAERVTRLEQVGRENAECYCAPEPAEKRL